jgi:hypothetical protein
MAGAGTATNASLALSVLEPKTMASNGHNIHGIWVDLCQALAKAASQGIDGLFRYSLPLIFRPHSIYDIVPAIDPAWFLVQQF